jgi:predicted phosphodiesterase
VKINYFSDIHLEFGELGKPSTDADIIIAAGDIGIFKQGTEWLKTFNKPVIYVAGNHEFYGYEHTETLLEIREQCTNSNISFLENEQLVFNGVRFLGCTLWADLFAEGKKKAEKLDKTLNDFRKIQFLEEAFDPNQFSWLYHRSKEWLETELAKPFTGKTVVITHHAPTTWSWNDSPKALKKLAYCNDLKALFHEYDIAAWFHGHIHSPADYRIAGARILSNPRGYVGRKIVDSFDLNKTVEI